MFEYKKTTAPNRLTSGGLGPCIAVGAMYEGRAYMVHMVSLYDKPNLLNILLKDLKKDVKDKDKLKIHIAGGDSYIKRSEPDFGVFAGQIDEDIENSKQGVLDLIRKEGFIRSVETVYWNLADCVQRLLLIPGEGRAELYEETDEIVTLEIEAIRNEERTQKLIEDLGGVENFNKGAKNLLDAISSKKPY